MTTLFNAFIDDLNMDDKKKKKIKNNIENNWICKEWYMQFIDAERLPVDTEPL